MDNKYPMGSSPLARGLPVRASSSAVPQGIIPARAGFTQYDLNIYAITGDHPRSRGVYATAFHTVDREDGSSPLARGLRSLIRYIPQWVRIIPARAGFTR